MRTAAAFLNREQESPMNRKTLWTATIMSTIFLNSGCVSTHSNDTLSGQSTRSLKRDVKVRAELEYLLYLPDEAAASGKKWPLMLFLHGAGERGDDIEIVKRNGPPMLAAKGRKFPFIIASPQCPREISWSNPTQVIALNALIDELVATHPIDENRIYLTGLSMGGFGTWTLAATYPERFAAIAPICGGGNRMEARRLVDMPIWVFHGAKDKVVPISMSQEMVDALRQKGADPKFTIYPETGHNSWIEAYEDAELYAWMLAHSKDKEK